MLEKPLTSIKTFTITFLTWFMVVSTILWFILSIVFLLIPLSLSHMLCKLLDSNYKVTTYTR